MAIQTVQKIMQFAEQRDLLNNTVMYRHHDGQEEPVIFRGFYTDRYQFMVVYARASEPLRCVLTRFPNIVAFDETWRNQP